MSDNGVSLRTEEPARLIAPHRRWPRSAAVQAQDGLASLTQVKPAADSGINEPVRSRSQNDYSYQPQYTPSPGAAPRTQNPDYPAEDWAIPTSASATSSSQFDVKARPSLQLANREVSTSAASSINIYHSPPLASSATSPPQNYGSPPTAGKRSDELLRTSFGGRSSPSAGLSTSPQPSGLRSSPSAKIDFGTSLCSILRRRLSVRSLAAL